MPSLVPKRVLPFPLSSGLTFSTNWAAKRKPSQDIQGGRRGEFLTGSHYEIITCVAGLICRSVRNSGV